ncbi:MAG: HAMP domain-containing histidine kinase [candidate division KSB1 bacterium]|nr:HAMP domain-containing histidine kinase [candidate division KSB1 bacterium]
MGDRYSSNIIPLKSSLRTRLILVFVVSVLTIFLIAGYYLLWEIRATLDAALGKNLETMAKVIALEIDPNFLLYLQPGDESSRTYQNILATLQRFQSATNITRVYLFGKDFRSIVDSDPLVAIGQELVQLKFNQSEVAAVFNGLTASSTLFEGRDGKLYKTGFAPIKSNGEIVAGVAVEGSAEMLNVVRSIQKNLVWMGLVIMLAGIIIGGIFASRITNPIKRLEAAAGAISGGDLQHPIPEFGRDEVGFLARTMEEMRQNILERDRQQQAMLAGVAHEIRNPLGGIELFAGLLSSEVQNNDLKNYAQKILKEVQNLKAIIQNFLDYARPLPAQRVKCDIRSVWNEAIGLLAGELHQIQLQFNSQSEGIFALADPQHLKQVFLNLIKNSIDAMPNGGTIFVHLTSQQDRVKISYQDTGKGIPAELEERIFQPFFTTREKGTGLGLAIVKNLITENGGSIRYVPSNETGARFEVELVRYVA